MKSNNSILSGVIYFLIIHYSLSVFADDDMAAVDIYAYNKSACDYMYESPTIGGSRTFLFIQRETLPPLNGIATWEFRQIVTKLPTESEISCENFMFTVEQKPQPARSCPSGYHETPFDIIFTYNRVFMDKKPVINPEDNEVLISQSSGDPIKTDKMTVERDAVEAYCVCYKEKPIVYFELRNNKNMNSAAPAGSLFDFQWKSYATACM